MYSKSYLWCVYSIHIKGNFLESSFNIALVRKAYKATGIVSHSVIIYQYQIKDKYKKEWAQTKYNVNAWWQIPVQYGSKPHIPPTYCHLLAAQQEPLKKLLKNKARS